MTTIRGALRQLVKQEQEGLPKIPEQEIINGKSGRIDWGTSGSGSSGGGSSAAGGGVAPPQPALDTELYEIEGARTYWPEQEIFDEDGEVSVDAEALRSCQVQDAKGNTATVYFTNPF